jgi:outer membrane protein OmpA-like peptidoglycan-associated protein
VATAAPTPPPPEHKVIPVGNVNVEGNKVKIPGELEFDTDKATLKDTAGSKQILSTLVDFMKQNPNVTKLRVEGHTDNQGTPDHNMKLSQERAEAVKKYLGEHGVDPNRIATQGYGQTHPVVDNDTTEHKAINRRTEFHLQEIDGKAVDQPAAAAGGTTPATATGAPSTPASPTAPKAEKKMDKPADKKADTKAAKPK